MAAMDAAIAGTFDTTLARMMPRKAGASVNLPMVADTSRAEFDAKVTIERGPPAVATSLPNSERMSGGAAVSYEAVMTALVTDWPWVPARGDRVTQGSVGYDVAHVDRDGSARAVFYMNSAR